MMKIQNGMRQEIVRNGRKMGTCDNRPCCIGVYYRYNTVINHQTRIWHKHYIEIIPLNSSYSYYSHNKKRGKEEQGDLYRRIFASFHSFIHYFMESICFAFSPWFIYHHSFSRFVYKFLIVQIVGAKIIFCIWFDLIWVFCSRSMGFHYCYWNRLLKFDTMKYHIPLSPSHTKRVPWITLQSGYKFQLTLAKNLITYQIITHEGFKYSVIIFIFSHLVIKAAE